MLFFLVRCESRCRSLTAINSSFDDEEQHEGWEGGGPRFAAKVVGGATLGLSFMAFKGSRMSLNAEDYAEGNRLPISRELISGATKIMNIAAGEEPRPKTAPSTNGNASSEAIVINDVSQFSCCMKESFSAVAPKRTPFQIYLFSI